MTAITTEAPSVLTMFLAPFDEPTWVADTLEGGKTLIYKERFDSRSFLDLPLKVPLLRSHDRAMPLGWIAPRATEHGIEGEAVLSGGPSQRTDILALVADGLLSGTSVGFMPDSRADRWTKARDGSPEVLRRGARLIEASLVLHPAYRSAKVFEHRFLTEADEARCRQHAELDREFRAMVHNRRLEAQRYTAELDDFLADADARGRELPDKVPTTTPTPVGATRRAIRDSDVIGRDAMDRWVYWGEADGVQRQRWLTTGSIWPTVE